MDFGTYVRVRSIFFGISVVFAYMSTHYALGGVAGLLVPSSLLIRGAPVAPPTLPVFFSLRPAVVRAAKELALRPAPPDWASASLSFRLGLRRVLPGSLSARFVVSLWVGSACGSSEASFLGFLSGQFFCSYCHIYAVSRVLPGFTRISGCEGHFAQILHAELSSNVLMEPACHFMVLSRSDSKMLLFQVHWGDTDSCWSGYSSGSPLIR